MDSIIKNFGLNRDQAEKFAVYAQLLKIRNAEYNLTAVTDDEGIYMRHFADSLSLLRACDYRAKRVIDVGTGAGFPGVPLKIAEPDLELTLLDSLGKRIRFLEELKEVLGIEYQCVHGRAEEISRLTEYRESYDIVVSRALAGLNVLCELCMPFVREGGRFLAMKSEETDAEIRDAEYAVKVLGGVPEDILDYEAGGIKRRLVIIKKLHITPEKYPRRNKKIQNEPLRLKGKQIDRIE